MEPIPGGQDASKATAPAAESERVLRASQEGGEGSTAGPFAAAAAMALGLSALIAFRAPSGDGSPVDRTAPAIETLASAGPAPILLQPPSPKPIEASPAHYARMESPRPLWQAAAARGPGLEDAMPGAEAAAPPASLPPAPADVARRAVSARSVARLKVIDNFGRISREDASPGRLRLLRLDERPARGYYVSPERSASIQASPAMEARVEPPAPSAECDSGRCSEAARAHLGGKGHRSGVLAGKKQFLGMCGDSYTYELTNFSDRPWSKVRSLDRPEVWDVSVPPGGSTVIKSASPLGRLSVDF